MGSLWLRMRLGGVLEETPSLFLCPLAVPLPSSLASPVVCPWEPELSTLPQLCHVQEMCLAGGIYLLQA